MLRPRLVTSHFDCDDAFRRRRGKLRYILFFNRAVKMKWGSRQQPGGAIARGDKARWVCRRANRHLGNYESYGSKPQIKRTRLDRRRFLSTAGLLAAGSAFGSPLLGCVADFETNIPCLGVVPAPVPVAGMSYIRASQIGCALDCDLRNGRNKYTDGVATDDGPPINAAMAGATASNPITLIMDGSASVSGLFLPAGGHWSIAGLVAAPGSS